MFVTDNKVILHMPRCGGSSIRWGLIKSGISPRFTCEHAPIYLLPEKYKEWPKIGFIRHPIDWYISIYNYAKYHSTRNSVSRIIIPHILSNGFILSCDEFINNALDLTSFFSNPANLSKYKKRLVNIIMNTYCCWQAFIHEDIDSVTSDYFENRSYFDYKFNLLGLNDAKIYRMEDGIDNAINIEFPGVQIGHQNKCIKKTDTYISPKTRDRVYKTHKKYFTSFQYD
jgi:hypothetical protein